MKALTVLLAGTVCVVALGGCATEKAPPPMVAAGSATETGDGKIERSNVVTMTATVVAIDHKKRMVTLRGPEGNTETIHVDESVRNLPQVKKGDEVAVTYYESRAIQVKKPGEATPGITSSEGMERAQPGAMPGGVVARKTTLTATITAIDRKKDTATLKGPKGKSVTVKVQDPSRLEKVKVGDLVQVNYTEAVAVAVEKATKRW